MSEQDPRLTALVPHTEGALVSARAQQAIAVRMAQGLLARVQKQERDLLSLKRYRVGDYEFRATDHEQLQRWARRLEITPEALVAGLVSSLHENEYPKTEVAFEVRDGAMHSMVWDFEPFPLDDWDWIGGLALDALAIKNFEGGSLPRLPASLRALHCGWSNQLSELDLRPVPGLQVLSCWGNQLSELDLSPVPGLQKLWCHENQLTELDLSPVPGLQELWCHKNQLTELDLRPVPGLQELACGENQLTELDLRPVPGLQVLGCGKNPLTELDLSPVPGLQKLWCYENQLTELDLSPVPGLQVLWCRGNQLTELDLRPVPGLQELYCGGNQLSELDLRPVPGLQKLDCIWNQLGELDLRPVPGLQRLKCDENVRLIGAPAGLDIKRS